MNFSYRIIKHRCFPDHTSTRIPTLAAFTGHNVATKAH